MEINELRQKSHLSASSINDYLDCGLMYKLGRILKLQPEFDLHRNHPWAEAGGDGRNQKSLGYSRKERQNAEALYSPDRATNGTKAMTVEIILDTVHLCALLKLCSLAPLQLQANSVLRVRAADLNCVTAPPWEISSKLEGLQGGENGMVEEAAQSAGVMTTDLEGIPYFMTGITMSLRFDNGCNYFVANAWILSHFTTPLLGRIGFAGADFNIVRETSETIVRVQLPFATQEERGRQTIRIAFSHGERDIRCPNAQTE